MSCIQCNGPLKYGKQFCSYLCQKDNERKQYIERWLDGKEPGIRAVKTLDLSHHIRRWLLEKTNCSCEECGWNKRHPVDDRPLVEIDHVDGDASNNRPENLKVLCPNCHSMTPTFRARNKNGKRQR